MNMKELITELLNIKIKELNEIYKYLEKNNLLDTQEVLNFLDSINEISIRH